MNSAITKLKPLTLTILFAYCVSLILTHISEVSFWYLHGNNIFVPALWYLTGVIVFLGVIQYFNITNLTGVYLAGIIYGIYIEGVLAPRIYEGGWFDPWALVWTSISWHAMLSVVLIFYLLRKWILAKKYLHVSIVSVLYGVMWGLFIPLNSWFEEPGLGIFTIEQFAVYAFSTSVFMVAAMFLIGYVWQTKFYLPLLVWIVVGLFSVLSFVNILAYGADPIRLFIVTTPFVLLLYLYRRRHVGKPNIFEQLAGKVSLVQVLPVFLMPIAACAAYYFAVTPEPWSEDMAMGVGEILTLLQVAACILLLAYVLVREWAIPARNTKD